MIARRRSITTLPSWARKGENKMPLSMSKLSASVRIIGDEEVPGSKIPVMRRAVIGTGFLCAVASAKIPGHRYPYVVTAHHVIEDQNPGRIEVQAPEPMSQGQELQAPVTVTDWVQPVEKLDLAVARFSGVSNGKWAGLTLDMHFLPPEAHPDLGADVHYVGILEEFDRVMARSGTFGALYQEGLDHPGAGGYEYPAHLVDCRTYNGFSGSPCYAVYAFPVLVPLDYHLLPDIPRSAEEMEQPRRSIDYHSLFCGMVTWHLTERKSATASQYGVVVVMPSSEIWKGLMSKELQDERDAEDEHILAYNRTTGPQPTNVSTAGAQKDEESEFDRFQTLARQLVNTPKPKPDEKGETE